MSQQFAKLKILVKGYAKSVNKKIYATSTAVLIQENGMNVIVDPGMDRPKLVKALKKEKLKTKDIDYVVVSHIHLDHSLLAGMFEKAKIVNHRLIHYLNGLMEPHAGKIPGTKIKILKTSGHVMGHCSVLANTKELGKVIVAADAIWWFDNEKQKTDYKSIVNHLDDYAKSKKFLKQSRCAILKLANYVIPGHGEMFKVEK